MSSRSNFHLILALVFYCINCLGQVPVIETDQLVTEMAINADGRLHVLGSNKLCQYEGRIGVCDCKEINIKNGIVIPIRDGYFIVISNDLIYDFREDKLNYLDTLPEFVTAGIWHSNKLYLATTGGLYEYSIEDHSFKVLAFENEFLNNLSIYREAYLLLAMDEGFGSFNIITGEKRIIPTGRSISEIDIFRDSLIVLRSSRNQLEIYNSEYSSEKSVDLGGAKVSKMVSDKQDLFLLSEKGVLRLDENKISVLIEKVFSDIICTGNNLLAAKDKSIYSLDLTHEFHYNDENNYAIAVGRDQEFWLGQDNRIVNFKNGGLVSTIDLPSEKPNVYISSLVIDLPFIYAGTMGEGLYVYRSDGSLIKHIKEEGSENENNIIQLELLDGRLWIGHLSGLKILDARSFDLIKNYDALLGSNYLYCFEPITNQKFYIGTSNNGVLSYDSGVTRTLLEDESIYALAAQQNDLFVGTEKSGLFYVQGDAVELIMPEIQVYSILVLDSLLLVNTKSGCCIADLSHAIRIPLSVGQLEGNNLNAFGQDDNSVYLAYKNGVLEMDKGRLLEIAAIKLHLNHPEQFNKVLTTETKEFDHDANSISFTFHSNSFYQSQSTFYKYRLMGYDTSWRLTQLNRVDYYNLNPGNFEFQVSIGYDEDFVPNSKQAYFFHIKKPFWTTGWFLALMAVLLVVLIYWIVKKRESAIITKQAIAEDKLKFELAQLRQQIDPHFLFNSFNSLIGLIEENPQAAVIATEKISNFYRKTLAYQDVDLIDIETELELGTYYFDIHKIRFENYIELNMDIPEQLSGKLIPLSMQLIIENAIKHNVVNKAHKLLIRVSLERPYLVIENKMNRSVTAVPESGYGLTNLEKRYALHTPLPLEYFIKDGIFIVKLPIVQ